MSEQYGKIEPFELNVKKKEWGFRYICKDFNLFSKYLENKDAYIIHYFSSFNKYRLTDAKGYNNIYPNNYIIDNYGNTYNVAQSLNRDYPPTSENFICFLEYESKNYTFDKMHPYTIFNNKLSNKQIKLLKLINICEEDCMKKLIENLLIENILEDKEEDIHFMRNKNKELRDTNKELLLKVDEMKYFLLKVDEMKEKHNELVNRLLDKIVELSDTLNTARMKINEKN